MTSHSFGEDLAIVRGFARASQCEQPVLFAYGIGFEAVLCHVARGRILLPQVELHGSAGDDTSLPARYARAQG